MLTQELDAALSYNRQLKEAEAYASELVPGVAPVSSLEGELPPVDLRDLFKAYLQ